jgi:DNA polymerase I-like protein with 3'-5' exonuclease and polymerase domains
VHASQVITDTHSLAEAMQHFLAQDSFVIDVETIGEDRLVPAVNQVLWVALATHGRSVVIPLGHPNGDELLRKATWRKNKDTGLRETIPAQFSPPRPQLRPSQVFEALEPLLFSDRQKIAHNVPFDILSVAKYYDGAFPEGPYFDTAVAQWAVNENLLNFKLKPLLERRFGLRYDDADVGKRVEDHTFRDVALYAWLDARGTWLLKQDLDTLIDVEQVRDIWNLEMDLVPVLLHMQSHGCPVDVAELERMRTDLRAKLITVEADCYRAAGRVINLGSYPQKADLLYGKDGFNLKPLRFTDKGAPSTDAAALKLYPDNEFCRTLLEYQEFDKLLGTYVEGYLGNDKKRSQIFDGRIYPSFKQHGAKTGRFSCSAPNVQNWPRPSTDFGKRIRDIIIPGEDQVLLVADYGQIEQRILAHYCGPGALMQGFLDGQDAHTTTASTVYGVRPEDVTKEQRQDAKAIAFAINYDAGPATVGEMAGCSERKARQLLKMHEQAFPEIYAFKRKLKATVMGRRPTPYLRTILGRKRRLPDLLHRNKNIRADAERQIVNSCIQGGNADLTKLAMVRFYQMRRPGMQLLLTVHDELAALAPRDDAEECAKVLHEAMAGPEMQMLAVPVVTDVKICNRWSEGK